MSITVDKIQLEIAVKHDKTRQEIAQVTDDITTETNALKKLQDEKRKAMKKYKDESHPEVVKATRAYEEQTQKIDALRRRKDELRASLKVEGLSISEVRDELKRYNMQLNNLTPGTEKFNQTKEHVEELKRRLKELTTEEKTTKESIGESLGLFNAFGFAIKNAFDLTGLTSQISELTSKATDLAMKAEGIELAFQRINSPGLLDKLREATRGTVSDLELMRQAVQFKDFNLDVEQLGNFLAFAQQKAKDTGQSIDYLVSSIVTGLGRQSKQILDNLGISASEITEEMGKGGDMVQAVSAIVARNMKNVGDYFETAGDRAARAAAQQENALLELGRRIMPIKEAVAEVLNTILTGGTKVLTFLVENRKTVVMLTAAVTAYTVAVKAAAAAAWIAEKATKAWNLVLKASPLGLFTAAIVAAASAIALFRKNADDATTATTRMANAQRRANDDYMDQKTRIDQLSKAVHDNTLSIDARREALDRLKEIIPGYNALLDEEGRLTRDNTTAIDEYLKRLKQQLLAKSLEDELVEAYKKQREASKALSEMIEDYKRDPLKWNGLKASLFGRIRQESIDAKAAVLTLEKELDSVWDKWESPSRPAPTPEANVLPEAVVTPTKTTKPTVTTKPDDAARQRREAEQQLKASYDHELVLLREQRQKELMTEEQYQQQKYLAEQRYLRDLGELREKSGASDVERQEVQDRQLDALLNEQQRLRQQQIQQMQNTLATAQMSYNVDQAALEEMFWQGSLKDEAEYQQKKTELQRDYLQQRISILRQYGGDATSEELQLQQLELATAKDTATRRQKELEQQMKSMTTQQKLQQLEQNAEVLGWQRTQEMKTQILAEEEARRRQIAQEAASAINGLMQSTTALFSSLQQRELATVDAKYKQLIATARKQGRDTTRLEEQQQAERMEIQKKYAQRQFKLQVLQIIAATAQAIANVWKQWAAYPPVAAALSAAAAAQGAIQMATAKAQADQAAGLYEGGYSEGYTRQGDPRKQAGVIPVHQSEFVANHHTVGNPQLRPLLDAIDRHQRRGDVQLLDATRLLAEAYGVGRAGGGYAGPATSATGGPLELHIRSVIREEVTPLLENIERNTGRAMTVRSLRNEISHEERLEQNARR